MILAGPCEGNGAGSGTSRVGRPRGAELFLHDHGSVLEQGCGFGLPHEHVALLLRVL